MIGAAVRRYTTEGKDKRFIAGAFARYVSPKVVKQILADPARLALGGERREVTLFFSDLQGFTSISEGMNPPELVAFLNEYTTLMADVITGPGLDGTIDKYIGDSVMAFWGAPLPQPDHARRGLLAALACQERLRPVLRRPRRARRAPAGDAHRLEQRDLRRRQHGFARPLRLHRHRRHGEPGLAPRGDQQGVRHARDRLGEHLAGGAGGGVRPAAGPRARQGQGRSGRDLRGDGDGRLGDRVDARAGRRLRRGPRRLPGTAVAADDRTGRGHPAHDARATARRRR